MYETHFGLSARPFADVPDASRFVPLPTHEAIVRRLRYGLEHSLGPVVVFGPSGAGKTLLAGRLGDELGWPRIHLSLPGMKAAELLAYLADEMEAPAAPGTGLAGSVRRIQNALVRTGQAGKRLLLVVDEAHLIEDPEAIEALRLLLNQTVAGIPVLGLALVGAPELLLRLPETLTDRLAAQCAVGPLPEAEAAAYVLGRLAAAGAVEPLFDHQALQALSWRPTPCPAAWVDWRIWRF